LGEREGCYETSAILKAVNLAAQCWQRLAIWQADLGVPQLIKERMGTSINLHESMINMFNQKVPKFQSSLNF
jgi:hypothetical protein